MKYRAYSTIEIKAVTADGDERIIEGIASTPSPDRMGDIVEPLGAQFKTPMPLLWQHDSRAPVGHVTWAKPNKTGIPFKAKFVQIDEPGNLKDRLDEAWQSVKAGLVRAVSIGFASIERAYKDDGGIHFLKWEWLELSLVTIPANQEATITTIKTISRQLRAASGLHDEDVPGASGRENLKLKGLKMKTIAERIAALQGEISPKRLRMKAIDQAAIDDGNRRLNADEAEEFDELASEVKDLEGDLIRLQALDTAAATARPAAGASREDAGRARSSVAAEPKATEEKGVGFARAVMLWTHSRLKGVSPMEVAKARFPNMGREAMANLDATVKALVAGGTTTDPSWAGPLVNPTNLANEFVEFLRPMTILGKFGVNGVPALRPIPFNVQFPAQVTGGDGYWVGEGQPKPLTRFSFEQIILRWTKVANIAVVSEELLRFSTPSAELVVRNALAEALQGRLDSDFINPAITLVADTRPASITNGATTFVSSGNDAAAVRYDIRRLLGVMIAANMNTGGLVFIMRQAQALALGLMRNDLGQKEFPDININGGTLEGVPVITSQYVPTGIVVAAVAPEIYLADDGAVSIDLSREASLEMDTVPTNAITNNASPPISVEQAMVSMFQTNSVAIRAERFINWRRRRVDAVAYLTAVGWGNEVTSPPQSPI